MGDSSRLISSAVPFRAPGGQMLLFGGGSFRGGGAPIATAGAENGQRKRPLLMSAHEEELHQLHLGLEVPDDDVDQLCGSFEYELHQGAPPERTTKRRLTAEQVQALELSFEEEKRTLEPERKSELARRLGIAPRQVAVWFQNRRARWRAKQLERDFDRLKAAHDELLAGRDALVADNDRLRSQVVTLTEKLQATESPASHESDEQAATETIAMQAAVVFVQLDDEGQLRRETTADNAVPTQGFSGGNSNPSPESYFAGSPSPEQSSEGDCGDENSVLLQPDAMILLSAVEHATERAEEDSWEWYWN